MHAGFFSFHSFRATIRWLKNGERWYQNVWVPLKKWGRAAALSFKLQSDLNRDSLYSKAWQPRRDKTPSPAAPISPGRLTLPHAFYFFCFSIRFSFLSLFFSLLPYQHLFFLLFSFFLPPSTNRLFRTSGLSEEPPETVWHDVFRSPEQSVCSPQPQLSSSSSAAAEEFPARVLQQIVSHHLRCLGKYPSTVGGSTHRLCVGPPSLSLSLSLIYFLIYVFFSLSLSLWDERKWSTTVQNIQ